MPRYIATEQSGAEIEFRSVHNTAAWKRALRWHREGDYGESSSTFWTELWLHRITRDGKTLIRRELIQWDPVEPLCDPMRPRTKHRWGRACSSGHGGGVIVSRTCAVCGCEKVEDTWHSRPDGSVGESVSYR